LHHALMAAYESLLPADSFPAYCLYLSVNPAKIDVNVHPTKTEIKFEDEKHIYNLIKAAVRKALGLYVVQPQSAKPESSDWTDFLSSQRSIPHSNPDWGKLGKSDSPSASRYSPFPSGGYERKSHQDWQKILGPVDEEIQAARLHEPQASNTDKPLQLIEPEADAVAWIQVLNERYWVFSFQGELRILDRRLAQQKVLFHQYVEYLEKGSSPTQQSLFPRTLEFSASQMAVLLELLEPLKAMGFDLSHFGGQTLLVNGVPALLSGCDEQATLEKILEDYQSTQGDVKLSHTQSLALAMARSSARMAPAETQESERLHLVKRLMALEQPQFGIDGRPVYIRIGPEQITDSFKKLRNA
jgi:DNA mismatch repair protein MutL